jgi:cytochrome P450
MTTAVPTLDFFLVDDIGVPLDIQRLQMISMDPPRHDRLKQLVGRAFTPKRIANHEDHIRAIVNQVLDGVDGRDRFDLVAEVARPVPARVIGEMLGTPPEDDEKLVHWTNVFTAFEDPKVREPSALAPARRRAVPRARAVPQPVQHHPRSPRRVR